MAQREQTKAALIRDAEALFSERDGDASEGIDAIFRALSDQKIYDGETCLAVAGAVLEAIRRQYPDARAQGPEAGIRLYRELEELSDLAACARYLGDFYRQSRAAWALEHEAAYSSAVLALRRYAQKNFAQPVTMETAAREVGKSANYLSHLFKQECGVSFSRYVNQLRVEEAKKLITTSQMMIYEVAEAVGCRSYIHFAQIFKELEGVSPAFLRKAAQDDGSGPRNP